MAEMVVAAGVVMAMTRMIGMVVAPALETAVGAALVRRLAAQAAGAALALIVT